MNSTRIPKIIFLTFCVVFLLYLFGSASQLPQCVASHFNAVGEADGWMTRSTYLIVTAVFGLGLPIFMIGIFYVIRFVPVNIVSLPNRNYWLSPERRAETNAYLMRQSLWIGCLILYLMTGIHYLVVQANASQQHLSLIPFLTIFIIFLLAIAVWTINFIRHFAKVQR